MPRLNTTVAGVVKIRSVGSGRAEVLIEGRIVGYLHRLDDGPWLAFSADRDLRHERLVGRYRTREAAARALIPKGAGR